MNIPEGMTEVSREEFWTRVRTTSQNIHPRHEKFHTEWMVVGTRHVWGWSSRGFKGPFDYEGAEPERFAIAKRGEG